MSTMIRAEPDKKPILINNISRQEIIYTRPNKSFSGTIGVVSPKPMNIES